MIFIHTGEWDCRWYLGLDHVFKGQKNFTVTVHIIPYIIGIISPDHNIWRIVPILFLVANYCTLTSPCLLGYEHQVLSSEKYYFMCLYRWGGPLELITSHPAQALHLEFISMDFKIYHFCLLKYWLIKILWYYPDTSWINV